MKVFLFEHLNPQANLNFGLDRQWLDEIPSEYRRQAIESISSISKNYPSLKMIVSKTPLRLSFFSGGSDLPAFYKKEMGAALSVTINKHIYICAHRTPNIGIKTMYDSIEHVSDIKEMQEGLTKEILRFYDIKENI